MSTGSGSLAPAIEVRGLTRTFGTRVAVADLDLEVSRSEIVALLGPNGAGKTTTMRLVAGLIAPSAGSVAIDGIAMTHAAGGRLRARIGFLTESPGLWDRLSVRENLTVYAGLYGVAAGERKVDELIDAFGLRGHARARAAELSKGLRQKVALARALVHDPEILLLDEPTSGLDPEVTRTVRQLLADRRRSGAAILVSTHNLDEAERLADRVAVLSTRLLAIDQPSALRQRLTTGRVIVRVLGDPASWLPIARGWDPHAGVEDGALALQLNDREHDTAALVRALASAGADIVEARPDVPPLEDAYLHLMAESHATPARADS